MVRDTPFSQALTALLQHYPQVPEEEFAELLLDARRRDDHFTGVTPSR